MHSASCELRKSGFRDALLAWPFFYVLTHVATKTWMCDQAPWAVAVLKGWFPSTHGISLRRISR